MDSSANPATAATPDPTETPRRRKSRSPSYPGIALEQALRRAKVLYEHEGRHSAPIAQIAEHWDYSPKSSGAALTLAALKKFGLLEDEGSGHRRQARLSQLALSILLDERDEARRLRAIRDAAFMPAIHRELWDKYGPQLPSDGTLRSYLLLERNFTENGVKEFVPVFRQTMEFARPELDDRVAPEDDDVVNDPPPAALSSQMGSTATRVSSAPTNDLPIGPPQPSTRDIQIPVSRGEWITIQGGFPLLEAEWEQMMSVLTAMKPALTVADGDR